MSRTCPKCKVKILDDAVMCPLCMRALAIDLEDEDNKGLNEDSAGAEEDSDLDEFVGSRSLVYPDYSTEMLKMKRGIRIVIFSSIFVECVLLLVNYKVGFDIRWSGIAALALAYGCFTVIYSAQKNRSHQRKMIVQTILGLLLILAIDWATGFKGWTFTIAWPCVILAVDVANTVLMIVHHRFWQSYIMSLIWLLALSIIIVIVAILIKGSSPFLAIVAALATALLVVGILIIGDKKAESELERRFHM